MADEGLRARKRRQTRERIASVALELFLERGFDQTTIEEIARGADVSKRSFFDYFPTKEDVIGAWQDEFSTTLAAAVNARPRGEALSLVAEEGLTLAVQVSLHPQAIALDKLVRTTPSLQARDHVKYAKLEQVLATALLARVNDGAGRLRARLLAAIMIGCLRIASDERPPHKRGGSMADVSAHMRDTFQTVWAELRELGTEGQRRTERESVPSRSSKASRTKRKS